jgi:hypothetical protein
MRSTSPPTPAPISGPVLYQILLTIVNRLRGLQKDAAALSSTTNEFALREELRVSLPCSVGRVGVSSESIARPTRVQHSSIQLHTEHRRVGLKCCLGHVDAEVLADDLAFVKIPACSKQSLAGTSDRAGPYLHSELQSCMLSTQMTLVAESRALNSMPRERCAFDQHLNGQLGQDRSGCHACFLIKNTGLSLAPDFLRWRESEGTSTSGC